MARRWQNRPPGSNWGDFGDDDELGRLNLLTAEKIRQGVAEVKEGITFCLSLPLDFPGGSVLAPGRNPPRLKPTGRPSGAAFNCVLPNGRDILCDDEVEICLQYSTQWDALCHIGQLFDADGDGVPEVVYYNGYRGGTDVSSEGAAGHAGARKLGIETMAAKAIQGRAVLVDLKAHFGPDYQLVTHAMLAEVLAADDVVIEPGDMVVFHTGMADAVLAMERNPTQEGLRVGCTLDGSDAKLLQWVTDSGVVALIADNFAVEHIDFSPPKAGTPPRSTLHELCLFKLGIPLGELWHVGPLATWLRAHKRTRFLLTAPPLRLPGAVGSPVSPVATV